MWLLGAGVSNADLRLRGKLAEGDSSNLTSYDNPQVRRIALKAPSLLLRNSDSLMHLSFSVSSRRICSRQLYGTGRTLWVA